MQDLNKRAPKRQSNILPQNRHFYVQIDSPLVHTFSREMPVLKKNKSKKHFNLQWNLKGQHVCNEITIFASSLSEGDHSDRLKLPIS